MVRAFSQILLVLMVSSQTRRCDIKQIIHFTENEMNPPKYAEKLQKGDCTLRIAWIVNFSFKKVRTPSAELLSKFRCVVVEGFLSCKCSAWCMCKELGKQTSKSTCPDEGETSGVCVDTGTKLKQNLEIYKNFGK